MIAFQGTLSQVLKISRLRVPKEATGQSTQNCKYTDTRNKSFKLNENVVKMCFHKNSLVLCYALGNVNAIF